MGREEWEVERYDKHGCGVGRRIDDRPDEDSLKSHRSLLLYEFSLLLVNIWWNEKIVKHTPAFSTLDAPSMCREAKLISA